MIARNLRLFVFCSLPYPADTAKKSPLTGVKLFSMRERGSRGVLSISI